MILQVIQKLKLEHIIYLKKYKTEVSNLELLLKDEYLIPILIGELVEKGEATVKVFSNKDKWYGITYREDLPEIKEAITKMVADGLYD